MKPKGRPRFYNGRAITDSATREFEQTVKRLFAGLAHGQPFEGPIEVRLEVYFERPKKTAFSYPPRGDCDNLFKSVADAANVVLWADDSQIIKMTCSKKWSDSDGFALVIKEVEL